MPLGNQMPRRVAISTHASESPEGVRAHSRSIACVIATPQRDTALHRLLINLQDAQFRYSQIRLPKAAPEQNRTVREITGIRGQP